MHWIGIGLIAAGVLWESLLAPNMIGWVAILAGFLIMRLKERRWLIRTSLDWPVLFIAIMSGVSLLVTALPETTTAPAIRLLAGLAGFYGLANWAKSYTRILISAFFLVLCGTGLALLSAVIVNWTSAVALPIPKSLYEPFPLLVSDPVHPNIMASLMVLLLPLPLVWFFSLDNTRATWQAIGMRVFLGVATLSMITTLILTQSRGGIVAGIVGVLALLWLSTPRRSALFLTLTLAITGVAAILILRNQAPELFSETLSLATWGFRQQVWRTALQMMSDFPFTGIGMGTFNQLAAILYAFHETVSLGAHNLYLQIGLDLGIPGLIAYLSVVVLTLWTTASAVQVFGQRERRELRALAVGTMASLAAMITHGLADVTVWNTRAAFVPWLIIGLSTALCRQAMLDRSSTAQETSDKPPLPINNIHKTATESWRISWYTTATRPLRALLQNLKGLDCQGTVEKQLSG